MAKIVKICHAKHINYDNKEELTIINSKLDALTKYKVVS